MNGGAGRFFRQKEVRRAESIKRAPTRDGFSLDAIPARPNRPHTGLRAHWQGEAGAHWMRVYSAP